MELQGWYYKNTNEYHIWPFAEDFHAAFGTGVENQEDASTHLAAGDVAGVALMGVQELARRDNERAKENDALKKKIVELEQRLQALEKK